MKSLANLSLKLSFVFLLFNAQLSWSQEGSNIATKSLEVKPNSDTRSVFGVLFYTLGGYDDTQFKNADPSYSVYDAYVSFSWRLPSDIRFSILPTFGYTTDGNDFQNKQVADKFYWRDFSFSVSQNNILEDYLPAALDLKQKARLYLPTSDGSKEEGMIARLRLEMEAKYLFAGSSSIRVYAKPSYYFQRTTAYADSRGKPKSSKLADSQHGSEGDWNLNKTFSIKPGFEMEDRWSNGSETNDLDGRHASEISYRLGLEVRPIKDFNFTVGIQDKRDLASPETQPVVSYSLLTNLVVY